MNDQPAASTDAPRTPPPEFFKLLKAGDGAAAAVLVVWASGRIVSFPRCDADVAQSVACNLLERASREDGLDFLRGVANWDAYLRTTARREAFAQRRRHREAATAHQRRAERETTSTTTDATRILLARELLEGMIRGSRRLSPRKRVEFLRWAAEELGSAARSSSVRGPTHDRAESHRRAVALNVAKASLRASQQG